VPGRDSVGDQRRRQFAVFESVHRTLNTRSRVGLANSQM
jgi:hypothetical protein